MKNLAIIPARGGSKRIPKKNIKDFLDRPIISYSIESAIKSKLFDEVMVSTDNNEIAEVAKIYGASVPFLRSEKTADDFATLSDVIDEVKESYLKLKRSFDFICCILPTSPLIKIDNLEKGYRLISSNPNIDSVRPIVRFSYPIQRALKFDTDASVSMFNPEYSKTRSQDLEAAYHDAGQFYWMKYNLGLKGTNKSGIVISELEAQDIDNNEDWQLAELKYKLLNKEL